MSVKGRIVTDMIRFFTAQKMLGPKIQDGTLRKNLVEAPWHCPEEYINLPIHMRQFEMELLTPKEEDCGEVILQLHGVDISQRSVMLIGILLSATAGSRGIEYFPWITAWHRNILILQHFRMHWRLIAGCYIPDLPETGSYWRGILPEGVWCWHWQCISEIRECHCRRS